MLCFHRYICDTDGRWLGGRGHLVLRHAHGRGQVQAADVGGRRPRVQWDPALHAAEHQRGGWPGLLQGAAAEQRAGLPRQRRHLPQLREPDEAFLLHEQVTAERLKPLPLFRDSSADVVYIPMYPEPG